MHFIPATITRSSSSSVDQEVPSSRSAGSSASFATRYVIGSDRVPLALEHLIDDAILHDSVQLAHCFHMNHGREFQKLNVLFRTEVKALQAKGYYGDGQSCSIASGGIIDLSAYMVIFPQASGAREPACLMGQSRTIKDTNVLHDNQADYAGTLCGGAQSYVNLSVAPGYPNT
jgi:hypothetical protein